MLVGMLIYTIATITALVTNVRERFVPKKSLLSIWCTNNDIQLFCTKKAADVDRSNTSFGLTFIKNVAKETQTPDPLLQMQLVTQERPLALT